MIDDQDLVGQIEDEITLILGTREAQLHRLELEHQIVSKRAVKPEMLILGAAQTVGHCAQNREYRGLAPAVLFREALIGLFDLTRDKVGANVSDTGCGQAGEALRD